MLRFFASLALLLMVCLSAAAQQQQQYTSLVLPAPAGAPGAETQVRALNNSGQVFGLAGMMYSSYVPVVWTGGVPSILPQLPTGSGYHFTEELGFGFDFMNDSGTVLSTAANNAVVTPGYGYRPLLWQNGTPTVLPLPDQQVCTAYAAGYNLSLDQLSSRPMGLNAQNHVLVNACGGFWIWNSGSFQLLVGQTGVIITPDVTAAGNHLNNSDHAALQNYVPCGPQACNQLCPANACLQPQIYYQPGIYSFGGATLLQFARHQAASHAINNNDQVLFFFVDDASGGQLHLEFWDGAQFADLGLGGAASMNNLGEVVFSTIYPFNSRIYKNGVVSPLNVPPPAGGFGSLLLNDAGQIAANTLLTMSQPYAVLFTPTTINVDIHTMPTGLSFTADGTSYVSPHTFSWTPGSNHTIAVPSPQAGVTGTQYSFNSWSDGGAISHVVSPTTETIYTAGFTTQCLLTTGTSPSNAGTITAGGWRDSGTSVQITASSAAGFSFVGFSGDLTGLSNPQNILMDAPKTVIANFKATTTTSVSSQPNPSTFGQAVMLTAVVSSASGTPTGNVTFVDDATNIGTVALDAMGHATLSTSTLAVGPHSITAAYAGDANFTLSTSQVNTQTVGLAPTATALVSSTNPAIAGQVVSFTATVTSGVGTPSGTVTFKDGAATLGTGSLNSSGQAGFSTSSLAVGNHGITATYIGGSQFAGSSSATLTETISLASTTTALQITPNPSVVGQTVNLVATVTASSGGNPTGTVTFKEGNTTIATASIDANGTAMASISTFSLGTHRVKAIFAGTPDYAGSTSGVVKLTVNLKPTTTVLTSSQNPSVAGQTITFQIAVSSINGGTPTGTVSIKDGQKTLGTVTLDATGTATFATSTLKKGSHSITAVYGGDSTFAGSTSNVVNQTVN